MYIWKRILKNPLLVICSVITILIILAGIFAPWVAPHDPLETNMELRYASFSREYPLGNDYLGRCILSRIIYAIRPSFLTVLGVLVITVLIGCVLGMAAGYFGGRVDAVIMRVCDVFMALPSEVFILAFVGILGVGLKNILLAYVVLKWASFARLIRTSVQNYKSKNYVMYSRAAGGSSLHVILKHILPSALSEIIVISISSVSGMILMVSSMSYLGLGIQPPSPEWGSMLFEAKSVMFQHPEQMLIPGVIIVIISLNSVFIGDGLRDVLDPKHTAGQRGM